MPVTIVLVDDDPESRLLVRHILAAASDTMTIVGEAADGEEGFAVARRERPDIVITDLMMPRLNGIDLTRRIRLELPETGVVLISSHTEDAYRLMASDSGADAFQAGDRQQPLAGDPRRHRPAALRRKRAAPTAESGRIVKVGLVRMGSGYEG